MASGISECGAALPADQHPVALCPLAAPHLLWVSMGLPLLDISYNGISAVWGLLCLAVVRIKVLWLSPRGGLHHLGFLQDSVPLPLYECDVLRLPVYKLIDL